MRQLFCSVESGQGIKQVAIGCWFQACSAMSVRCQCDADAVRINADK